MDTHITIAGNLTDNPELRFTPTGDQVCSLRVAVTARAPDGQGGWRDTSTSFFRVTVWRAQAEHAAESLTKGARVLVAGRLRQRSWEPTTANAARRSRSRPTNSRPASSSTPPPSPRPPGRAATLAMTPSR